MSIAHAAREPFEAVNRPLIQVGVVPRGESRRATPTYLVVSP